MNLKPPSTMLTSAAPKPAHAPPPACCAFPPRSVTQGLNRHSRCQLFSLRSPHQHICNHSIGQTPGQAQPLGLGNAWLQLDLCSVITGWEMTEIRPPVHLVQRLEKEWHLGRSHPGSEACPGAALVKAKLQTDFTVSAEPWRPLLP